MWGVFRGVFHRSISAAKRRNHFQCTLEFVARPPPSLGKIRRFKAGVLARISRFPGFAGFKGGVLARVKGNTSKVPKSPKIRPSGPDLRGDLARGVLLRTGVYFCPGQAPQAQNRAKIGAAGTDSGKKWAPHAQIWRKSGAAGADVGKIGAAGPDSGRKLAPQAPIWREICGPKTWEFSGR